MPQWLYMHVYSKYIKYIRIWPKIQNTLMLIISIAKSRPWSVERACRFGFLPSPRGVEDWCYQWDCDRLGNRLFDAPRLQAPCQTALGDLPPPRPISQLPRVLFKMDIESGYLREFWPGSRCSDLWVQAMSDICMRCFVDFIDVTLADKYTNLIPTGEDSRAIPVNAMW